MWGTGAKDKVRFRKPLYVEIEKKLLESWREDRHNPTSVFTGVYLHPFGCSAEERLSEAEPQGQEELCSNPGETALGLGGLAALKK